jgi:hypothetical protein
VKHGKSLKHRLSLAAVAVCLATTAKAQNADCPHVDAPVPRHPPGAPPPFPPPIGPPAKTLAEQLQRPPPLSRELSRDDLPPDSIREWDRRMDEERRKDWLLDVEEGFVASVARDARKATQGELPPALKAFAVRADRLPLRDWAFLGYRETGPFRLHRYFRGPDRSLLEIQEWHYKQAGGAVFALPGSSNVKVAGRAARVSGLRAPSGCVESAMSWFDEQVNYGLRIVGPLDVPSQRRRLQEIAEAMAAATRVR